MHDRCSPRSRLRTAALLPVAVVAWLTLGTGNAMAAPSAHAAVQASTAAASDNARGNGQAGDNGQANGPAATGAVAAAMGAAAGTPASAPVTPDTASDSSDHSAGNAGTSGDVSQPQPLSTADQNSGGANGQCTGATYCSTRDGSPSLNGNGGGNATGKPCAGCVGKADNKNPPGQGSTDPYGTFPNNGYECDHNNGIGKSNPAHTGCQGTTTCDSSVEDCGGGGGGGCDSTTQDCGGGGGCDASTQDCGGGDCDTETSNADCTPGCPAGEVMGDSGDCMPTEECVPTAANDFCSTVEGEHHTRNPKPSTKPSTQPTTDVLGEKVIKTPSALPFTGAEGIGLMLGTAALAMTVGGGLMVAARRRRDELG